MITRAQAEDLLGREALYLDRREWDRWLDLYIEDAIYWVPAWRDESNIISDPDAELSLIYYQGKHNLEDRVWRIKSGLSVASSPIPRTVHQVTNIIIDADGVVTAAWSVHQFNARRQTQHSFFGRYEYRVISVADDWRIAMKKIILLNDRIPTVADFYAL
jgi:3-phenylpropionate/cinnamic acid dioxygenase small subunit